MPAAEMQRIVDETVEEARAGLTAIRQLDGWRLRTDRFPTGEWTLTGAPVRAGEYPRVPPEDLCKIVSMLIVAAGGPLEHGLRAYADLQRGALSISWMETK